MAYFTAVLAARRRQWSPATSTWTTSATSASSPTGSAPSRPDDEPVLRAGRARGRLVGGGPRRRRRGPPGVRVRRRRGRRVSPTAGSWSRRAPPATRPRPTAPAAATSTCSPTSARSPDDLRDDVRGRECADGRAGGGGRGRRVRRGARLPTLTRSWQTRAGATTSWMRLALDEARRALPSGDVPVGAVVRRSARARSSAAATTGARRLATRPRTPRSWRSAGRRRAVGTWRLDGCTLVVTLEPCTMCAGALVLARVDRLVFGAVDPKAGAVGSLWDVVRDRRLNHRPEVVGGVLADECGRGAPVVFPDPPRTSGNLSGGGVSERPKEHASKACEGASPPWVQIPPPPPVSPRGGRCRSDTAGAAPPRPVDLADSWSHRPRERRRVHRHLVGPRHGRDPAWTAPASSPTRCCGAASGRCTRRGTARPRESCRRPVLGRRGAAVAPAPRPHRPAVRPALRSDDHDRRPRRSRGRCCGGTPAARSSTGRRRRGPAAGACGSRSTPARHDGNRHRRRAEAVGYLVPARARCTSPATPRSSRRWPSSPTVPGGLDVAILPVSGWGLTLGPGHMDALAAARAVASSGPASRSPCTGGRCASRSRWRLRRQAPAQRGGALRRPGRAAGTRDQGGRPGAGRPRRAAARTETST